MIPRARHARSWLLVLAVLASATTTAVASPARRLHATLSDRPVKVCLAERLRQPPQLIVLGSSRADKVEPSLLQSLTGLRAFNAGVSGGTPDDALAYASFLHDLPGAGPQRVIWLLDVESFAFTRPNPGLLATPELAPYLLTPPQRPPRPAAGCVVRTSAGTRYSATGFRIHDFHDTAVERGVTQQRSLAISLAQYRRLYASYDALVPAAMQRFEQTVAEINSWGVTPVIVLTPVQPTFVRDLGAPWQRMHRAVVAYLASLAPRLRMDVIDASSIGTFGGTPGAFYDGVHMKVANVRLLVRSIVKRAGRFLGPVS